MTSVRRWWPLAAALCLLGAGCRPEPKTPSIQITGATFSGVELRLVPVTVQLMLAMKVSAVNPNSFDIKVRAVRGTVTLAGQHQLPVTLQPDVWLRSDQATAFDVPVVVPVPTAVALLRQVITTDCIAYRFEGAVDVTATETFKINQDNYPLTHQGCVSRVTLAQLLNRQL